MPLKEGVCVGCGAEFSWEPTGRGQGRNRKYCDLCRPAAFRKQIRDAGRRFYKKTHPTKPPKVFTCAICGEEFAQRSRRPEKYCSVKCRNKRNKAEAPHIEKTCAYCGRAFTTPRPTQVCCSVLCSNRLQKGDALLRGTTRKCAACGQDFEPRNSKAKFCSWACAKNYLSDLGKSRDTKWFTCLECGQKFSSQRSSRTTNKFCSRNCSAAWHKRNGRGRAGDRRIAPLNPGGHRHRAKKCGVKYVPVDPLAIFERDGYRCGICGKMTRKDFCWPHPLSPSLDHIIPFADGGDHVPANLQCAHFACNLGKGARKISGQQLRLL